MENEKGPMADVAITLVRGWARAELDAGCVLSPWSEARERTLHALALYGVDAAIIEANEQRIASAWEGAKLAHEAGTAWVARICIEREEAIKQRDEATERLASIKQNEGLLLLRQRQIFALEREVRDLRNMVSHREAEITKLKKEARNG